MKSYNIIIYLTIALCTASCAHKSGHNRRSLKSTSNYSQTSGRNVDVSISNLHGEENKLNGAEVFAKFNTAVFMVFTSNGYDGYQGSGFFINSDGLAVSNYHIFKGTSVGEEQIILANSDETHKVIEVVHADESEDFILFRVDISNTNYIPLAKCRPRIGETVYAIGSPRGLENTFSSGEVSQWRDKNLIQTSALIDHGSSGGALINEYGEAVGITSGTFADGSQANLNYALSIDAIKPFLNCL